MMCWVRVLRNIVIEDRRQDFLAAPWLEKGILIFTIEKEKIQQALL